MRKEERISIEENGIMHEFVIRQMPATQLEWWIFRAIQVVGSALEIPEGTGLDGIGKAFSEKGLAVLAGVDAEKAKPLLDEMLETASRIVDGIEHPVKIGTVDGYITNVQTLFKLRVECFRVQFSFFGTAVPSGSKATGTDSKARHPVRISSR